MSKKQMDETQLNEKRIKEAWQVMTIGEKTEYLWMYYKSWLVVAVLIVAGIFLGVSMYKNKHTEVLLNITIAGGDNQKVEWLNESFAEYAGIEPEDGIIKIQSNISANSEDATSQTALTTLIGAEAIDVLVCPKEIYEDYSEKDGFLRIEDVLRDNAGNYGEAELEDAIALKSDNILKKEEMIPYDDAYAAIPVTTQHQEMAAKFLEYLQQ